MQTRRETGFIPEARKDRPRQSSAPCNCTQLYSNVHNCTQLYTTASVALQVAHEAADKQALIHTQKWEFVRDAFQLLQATQHTFEEVRKAPVLAPPLEAMHVDGQTRMHASRQLLHHHWGDRVHTCQHCTLEGTAACSNKSGAPATASAGH